jgi:hypothetical protein
MTTQADPTPHTPDAATDALPPPWQRLLALSGVRSPRSCHRLVDELSLATWTVATSVTRYRAVPT